ncbi:MAG: DNA repair protein RadC [Myxococcota bacterium]
MLTTGNDMHTIVDPRQIFRTAVRSGAAGIIIAHNHPSGDPTASSADLSVTRRLAEAGQVIGIELLDHLILGSDRYVSLAEQGVLVRPGSGWRAQPLRE